MALPSATAFFFLSMTCTTVTRMRRLLALELHFSPVWFGAVGGPWFHFHHGDVVHADHAGELAARFDRSGVVC